MPAAESPQGLPWWRQTSAIALVAANLVPVVGVLLWDWHVLSVMLLFWLENVIVGLFNVVKILLAQGEPQESGAVPSGLIAKAQNVFTAAFFTVHYGMFCAGHGIFLIAMFGRGEAGLGRNVDFADLPQVVHDVLVRHGLLLAAVALVVSHGLSFYTHYLKPKAYEGADPGKTMFDPYKRVVILHVVILAGGFAAAVLGASVAPLLLLIALKTIVDLSSHRREHAVPYEREMRDFMAEHGHKFVRAEEPAAAQAAAAPRANIADLNDKPLAHYFGTWRAD